MWKYSFGATENEDTKTCLFILKENIISFALIVQFHLKYYLNPVMKTNKVSFLAKHSS